jgi:hypothetical protein
MALLLVFLCGNQKQSLQFLPRSRHASLRQLNADLLARQVRIPRRSCAQSPTDRRSSATNLIFLRLDGQYAGLSHSPPSSQTRHDR